MKYQEEMSIIVKRTLNNKSHRYCLGNFKEIEINAWKIFEAYEHVRDETNVHMDIIKFKSQHTI